MKNLHYRNDGSRLVGRHEGSVLFVSLIVLLVVTLLGLSVMEMSVMQERMASNAQDSNRAFQSSESLLDQAMRDEDILGGASADLGNAIRRGVGKPGSPKTFSTSRQSLNAEYVLTYMGENTPFAAEGQESSMNSDLPTRRFEMRMSVENTATQAGATVTQGFVPN
ncbi:PilX N-terminal domain-containing pilus assembly protein [Halomonadaceae bacterium KBTZ08]